MDIRDKLPAQYPYELNSDSEQGFVDAVHNNQINLAMYYMVNVVGEMQAKIEELRAELNKPAREVKKKTAAKKKTTEVADSE